jgi:DNA-binding PadR family transcriptional regulator
LTNISSAVILYISADDITLFDISANDLITSGGHTMSENKESIALTEAVFYILLSLYEPMHGYGIMQNVARLSGGRVNLAAGTLYGAINTLLEKGWIRALPGETNSRRKEYEITESGKTTVHSEIERLKELLHNGEIIEGGLVK